MHIEFGLKLRDYVKKARLRYYTRFILLLFIFFAVLVTIITLETSIFITLNYPDYIPYIVGGGLLVYLLLMIVYLRVYYNKQERKFITTFYELAKEEELHLERVKSGIKAYDYKKILTEAQILYQAEFDAITCYQIDDKMVYILYFSKEGLDSIIIHLPDIKKDHYYQVNNGNFMPPSKYLDMNILKLHFVHPLQLNYYASSNETAVKINIRKVMEGRFSAIHQSIGKTMSYIATPVEDFLIINEFVRPISLSLLKPLTAEEYSDRLIKLLSLQSIIYILIEKRKVWQKKSLQ